MSSQIATRLTAFATISAIEEDIRDHLVGAAGERTKELLVGDVWEKARKRFADATGLEPSRDDGPKLLEFCDFADLAKGLRQLSKLGLGSGSEEDLAAEIEIASPARNRVCHTRPLEPEDFPSVMDLSERLLAGAALPCRRLKETRSRIQSDPMWVFGLEIPAYWRSGAGRPHHNLPAPEFDDTGFLGRKKEREALRKLLFSAHPVITVIGEGGVGKTALALRCLYDLVAQGEDQPFHAIVWVSLKTSALVVGGTREVRDSVRDVLGLLQRASEALGSPPQTDWDPHELLREVLDYLRTFKVLLAVDNLETLTLGDLRALLVDLPEGSKLLLTSRVPLGEFEVRYALDRLDEPTAATLLRKYASLLNVSSLAGKAEADLRVYSNALFGNPLLIKWFVTAVAGGEDPSHLLSGRPSAFDDAVAFCFQNLFDRLSDLEQQVLYTIAAARKPLTRGELILLLKRPVSDVDSAIVTLSNSSMVRRPTSKFTDAYALTPIASTYISKFRPPTSELVQSIVRNLSAIKRMAQDDHVVRAGYEYDPSAFEWTTRDELIATSILRVALADERHDNFDSALRHVANAAQVAPTFSEVFRVEGRLRARVGDLYGAAEAYERALAVAPESSRLHYFYGLFLLSSMEDLQLAQEHLIKAETLDPKHAAVRAGLAMTLKRLGRYPDASRKYEQLLGEMDGIPKRHRLSNRDQAADCYRRWMERDLEGKDQQLFVQHFRRAAEIIREGAIQGETDRRLGIMLSEIMSLGCRAAQSIASPEILHAVLEVIADWPTEHKALLKQWARDANLTNQFYEDDWKQLGASGLLAKTIFPEFGQADDDVSDSPEREYGSVDSLKSRFGFLNSDGGERLFFAASECSKATFSELLPGTRVTFLFGQNKEGRCAVQIRLAPKHKPDSAEIR